MEFPVQPGNTASFDALDDSHISENDSANKQVKTKSNVTRSFSIFSGDIMLYSVAEKYLPWILQ